MGDDFFCIFSPLHFHLLVHTHIHSLFSMQSAIPKCSHGESSVRRQVKKEGPNKGRFFFVCRRFGPDSCSFFQWDTTSASTPTSTSLHSHKREERSSKNVFPPCVAPRLFTHWIPFHSLLHHCQTHIHILHSWRTLSSLICSCVVYDVENVLSVRVVRKLLGGRANPKEVCLGLVDRKVPNQPQEQGMRLQRRRSKIESYFLLRTLKKLLLGFLKCTNTFENTLIFRVG
jgi:hypothetical protein